MLETKNFWQYLDFTQQNLIKQSFYLLDWAENNKDKLHDYSFVVMPAAKAFEGFLKKLLFDLNLISYNKYNGEYFRIGKALNPQLEHIKSLKNECLYNELCAKCNESTAKILWQTWKKCRNRLFHYFPKEQQVFTLNEAKQRLKTLIDAIELALTACKL